jgi:hypothetical protein
VSEEQIAALEKENARLRELIAEGRRLAIAAGCTGWVYTQIRARFRSWLAQTADVAPPPAPGAPCRS